MSDYEAYHHNKDKLKKMAELWLAEPLDLDAATDLESLRKLLTKDYNMDSCCFLDCECRFSHDYLQIDYLQAILCVKYA